MDSLTSAKEPQPTFLADAPGALGRKEVAKGYAWNALFSLIGKLVFPLAQIFFYRKLGPEQIGVYAVLIPIYMICESLRDAGLALTYVADRDADERREGEYAGLAVINAAVFAAALILGRDALVRLFRLPQLDWGLQMVAFAILLTGLSTIPANKLQKRARFRDAGLVDFFSTLASLAAAFVLVLLGFGYKALIWQFVLRSAFFTVACWVAEPVRMRWAHSSVVGAIWKQSSHNLINNLLFTVYTVADNLLVTRLFGVTAVGNYNAAYTFGMKPVEFFSAPLGKTLLIAYTRKSHDVKSLSDIFARTIALSVLAMAPLYVFVAVFSKPLTTFLLSHKFSAAGPLLAILVLYCGCRSIGLLCGNVLVAMNKPVYNVYGWLAAYFTVGALLYFNRAHLTLPFVVEALTAGAVVVYLTTAAAAFAILRPNGEHLRKLRNALGLAAISSLLIVFVGQLPLGQAADLVLALTLTPVIHLVGIGLMYGGSLTACLSGHGLKAVYRAI